METKLFEVRAVATCMPIMAVKLDAVNEAEAWLLGMSGYGFNPMKWKDYIFVFPIEREGKAVTDPYKQDCSELHTAHQYINEHFDELEHGAVIDTDFILGRTESPVESDRFYKWGG
jgi:hypothetical protein